MRVGVLTGGRDCPGLNAVVRAVVRKGVQHYGDEFLGFVDGWRGPLDGDTVPLDIRAVRGTLPRGGTVLGTSRTHPLDHPDGVRRIRENLAEHDLDALITVGGRDTLGTAARLADEHGLPIVGVPKTIDNDLWGTDCTIGHDTAVGVATSAIDRLHTTAESHKRVLVVEVMGGDTGWIALRAGLAGGANVVLVPEQPFDVEQVCAWVTSRFRASYAPIVVVADGARPADGSMRLGGSGVRLSGVGEWLAREIEQRSGKEARTTVLGHLQRGGTPSPFDRWLATRFGLHAIDAVHDRDFGRTVALRGNDVIRIPIAEATSRVKRVSPELYAEAGVFFG
ncbi:ATP-dependent 6-phosphofructokinase [Streptomyces sp. XM83C]|uniref:ATP-dependent 6-phosphofructokinase n=1 Tax=Streptomyces sp. XM83C TaxID=2929781 RepID=UPI001FFBB132|nr:ATP-dependent 6-phosphofructokinase [Streptomyces sp. XM83C]MCK1818678.1 ATP-dependent 6-phosphofructokinase [Streptomyces sp. XM83C]